MKLLADLYLDEDVSVLVATLLAARGFDTLTTHDIGMLQRDDEEQLRLAIEQERCIVTHNRIHYERLHARWVTTEQHHAGIIVATRRTPYEIVRRLVAVLNALSADELADQLLYI